MENQRKHAAWKTTGSSACILVLGSTLLLATGGAASAAPRGMEARRSFIADVRYDWHKQKCSHPIAKRYMAYQPHQTRVCWARTGWRDHTLRRKVQAMKTNIFKDKVGWEAFQGRSDPQLLRFFKDTLTNYNLGGAPWFPIVWVTMIHNLFGQAALGLYLYKVPDAMDRVGTAMDTPYKLVRFFRRKSLHLPYWALWYLGGKKYVDAMIGGFVYKPFSPGVVHTNFALSVLDRWNLAPAQVKKIEDFCKMNVFQPQGYENATAGCLRYLGRIGTKDRQLQQFMVQYAGHNTAVYATEAIRALGHMGYKKIKRKLQANMARAKRLSTRLIKKGRRYTRKQITTYSTNFHAVESAIALIGLGDKTAYKVVTGWLMDYDQRNFLQDNAAFDMVFREAAFASPKAMKKLKKLLAKAYKKAQKALGQNPGMKRHVRVAAVSLLQMGDKTGVKHVLSILEDTDKNEIHDALQAMGASPGDTYGGTRSVSGIAHIKVGKKALSVRDADRIAKAIRQKFMFWRDGRVREYAVQATADIEAQIKIVKNRL